MKRLFLTILIVILVGSYGFPKRLGVLTQIMRPGMIQVEGGHLYAIEDATIFVYSLKDLSLTKKFGKKGEGPGELKVQPDWRNRIQVYPDHIFVESIDKLVEFSKDGNLINERRKPIESTQFLPVGNYFVAQRHKVDPQTAVSYMHIILYDNEFKEIKELYKQKFVQQRNEKGVEVKLFCDFINFQVCEDKIFIDESPNGFVFEVFDKQGNHLYRIEKEYQEIEVTAAHKEALLQEIKQDPDIIRRIKQFGSWENLTKVMQFTFPDYMPPVKGLEIADKTFYIQTFQEKDNKSEYVVLDLKGNLIKKVYLSIAKKPSLKDMIIGVSYQTIKDNKLFFLKENEETEVWELYVEEIK